MNPLKHLELLLKFDRTFNLRELIRGAVSPGGRVLDAGCGLGTLSQWAAEAGASAVDAVDLSELSLAQSLSEENGFANVITFHQQDLQKFMEDDERQNSFDCIIAMVYLNDPRRDEIQSKLTQQMKAKLLSRDGRIIPDRVEYTFAICDFPNQDLAKAQLKLRDQVKEIEGHYGLSFTALSDHLLRTPYGEFFPARDPDGRINLGGARFLSDQTDAFTIDYVSDQCDYPADISLKSSAEGHANVVVWWQRIIANDQLIFTNQSLSWIANPRTIQSGEKVGFCLDEHWRESNRVTITQ